MNCLFYLVVSDQTDTENILGTRARGLGPREGACGAYIIENLKLKVENDTETIYWCI